MGVELTIIACFEIFTGSYYLFSTRFILYVNCIRAHVRCEMRETSPG